MTATQNSENPLEKTVRRRSALHWRKYIQQAYDWCGVMRSLPRNPVAINGDPTI